MTCPMAQATAPAPAAGEWRARCRMCGTGCAGHALLVLDRRDDDGLCCRHWREAGYPHPPAKSEAEAFEALQRTRQAMLRRGGNARYMARSGKA